MKSMSKVFSQNIMAENNQGEINWGGIQKLLEVTNYNGKNKFIDTVC